MDKGIIGSLIGTGGSIASGIMNQILARQNANLQYRNERKLMQYQNDLNRKNAFDAPGITKRGMIQAGLNPASMQEPASIAGVSGGSASMPQAAFENFGQAGLNAYNSIRMADAQVELTTQEGRAAKAVADNADEYQRLLVEEKSKSIGYIEAQTGYTDTQKKEAEQRIDYLTQAYPKMLMKLGFENTQIQEQIKNLQRDLDLKDQQYEFNIENMPLQLKLASLNIMLAYKEGALKEAQAKELIAQANVLGKECERYDIENNVSRSTAQARIALAHGEVYGQKLENEGKMTDNEMKAISKDFQEWQSEYQKNTAFDERFQRFYNHLGKWTGAVMSVGSVMIGYSALKNANTKAAASQPAPVSPAPVGSPPAMWQP